MGQKAGSFYRIMNKEQGGGKQMMSDWLGPHSQLVWGKKEQGRTWRAQRWLGVCGLVSGYTAFLGKQHICRDMRVT